jgi:hypothetical protein
LRLPPLRSGRRKAALTLTESIDAKAAGESASYRIETYTYIYQSSSGSPEVDQTKPAIKSISVAATGKSAGIELDRLAEGHVYELHGSSPEVSHLEQKVSEVPGITCCG